MKKIILLAIVFLMFILTLYLGKWMFLVLFISMIALKIDSRYFILAAILHLWFAPFMLTINKNLANQTAVYAYYYLVMGVVYQFFEKAPSLSLEYFMKKLIKINYLYLETALITALVVNHFHSFMGPFISQTLLYIATIITALFVYQTLPYSSSKRTMSSSPK